MSDSWNNTIARGTYYRILKGIEKFPVNGESIRDWLEEQYEGKNNSRLKVFNQLSENLETILIENEGIVGFSISKIKPKLYGRPSYSIISIKFDYDNELLISDTSISIKPSKVGVHFEKMFGDIVFTKHAIDRYYERISDWKSQSDPNSFFYQLRIIILSFYMGFQKKIRGSEFTFDVIGGVFKCEKTKDKIIIKTFIGESTLNKEQITSFNNPVETLKNSLSFLSYFEFNKLGNELKNLHDQKATLLESKIYLPTKNGLSKFEMEDILKMTRD